MIELEECFGVRYSVVALDAYALARTGSRLDAVGVHHPPAWTHEFETVFEFRATRQRQHGIQALWRRSVQLPVEAFIPCIDDGGGAESAHKACRARPCCG